ncbi:uncharacterized protein LOC110448822 [Mizuhopecten yessoensis]|uniref:uncharacterized protein LOC110448822 n=1 Tax=Mizuhopecten yessoensis TaxID=6573 RepID=UPI000B459A05|nr:uncharacterized protein LOC110448822 [Mizuhopecten yessoensis]XP_021350955.1 uncharacterized protein LOC110448822 [Mizuhopecten yessoensis]
MEGLALKIGKLRQIINRICSVGQEQISDHQLQEILQQINLIFNHISKCRFCGNFISDTLEFVNIINNVADLSPTVKSEVVSSCIVQILELITRGDVSFGFKVEILKLTNVLLENCPNSTKESLLTHAVFEKLIVKFGRQLDTVGDYEYQVGLIECLFRIIPKKFRLKYGKLLFSDALLLEQFLAIKDQDFETDCRTFLNDYNSDASQKQRVRSIPCISAFLGDRELKKPNDPGYDYFWVDFNYGSGRLTIFCEDYSAGSQDFSDDGSWETLSVWKSDVQRYKVTAEEDCHHLDVELINPIPTLYPSQTGVSGKIVSFTFDSVWRMEEAAVQTFGGDKWFKKPSKTKVSLPTTSVCVRASDSPDFEMDSNYDELDEEIGTFQEPSVDQDCLPKFFMPAQPTRVKVSVPCVAVVVDSSQNSVMEPAQAIAMKYVQSLQAQGIGNNTSEPEEGTCPDDDLEGVSLGDEKSSPISSKVSEPVSCINLGFGNVAKKAHQKSAGIPTPKTPTNRGLSKVKVKTPVAVLTPNEGTKSRKTLKKKLSTAKPSRKSSKSQEKHAMKTVAAKENESISFPDSCPGNDDNKKVHAEQKTKTNCQSRANIVQKKQPCDAKRPRKAKNNSSSSTISDTAVDSEPKDNSTENASNKSKVEQLKTRKQRNAQEKEHDSNILKTVQKKSTELEATKQDFAFSSQDSLINENTCEEIYSMEQDGLSFTEECDKDVQCSMKGSDNKTSKVCAEKDSQHSFTTNVDNTNRKKKENSKVIKEKEQISKKKRSKSKRGKDLKIDKDIPDQGIQNDNEVDVIQSSCDFEKFENGQKSKTANNNEPVDQDFNCGVNKIAADNKKAQERSNDKSKNRTTSKTISEKSDASVLDCDTEDFIQNMNVSATFGKGNRKKKLSKLNNAQDVDKMIEQTKTGYTCSDNDNPIEDSVDTPTNTCTAVNSKKDQHLEKTEQSKKQLNNKGNSKRVDLDIYDFNEVDQMSRSFIQRKGANSGKADKLVECEIDVQSENDIPAPSTNNGVVLEKKSRKIGRKKDKKMNKSENEELNTAANCDKDAACNQTNNSPISQTDKRSRLKKVRKAALETDVTSTEHSSRKTRSGRQRKQTTTKTCAKESQGDKEIEVIQSSVDAENDGDLDSRTSVRNEDKCVFKANPFAQPAKGKQNRNKQLLVSTPFKDFDVDVEHLNGENEEILSSIHCSDSNETKGCMEQLEKQNVKEDKNILTKKKKHGVGHVEKESLDNDKQPNQLTGSVQKGKCSSKSGKGRPGRPKRKASLRDDLEDEETGGNSQLKEDVLSLSKKHPSHGNTVTSKKTKVDECNSDVHCEDDLQSTDDGLVSKKGFEKAEARKERKSRKYTNVELEDTEDQNNNKQTNKNPIKKTEKRKTRLNKGRHTAPETTADISSVKHSTTETRSNTQRNPAVSKLPTEESDTESQDDNEIEVIHSSFSPETGEGVLNNRKSIRNEDNDVSDAPSDKEQRLAHVAGNNHVQDDGQNKQQSGGDVDEEINCSPPEESSLALFNTNLSQGKAIKSLSQRKFFKERSGSSTYERHDMQSACVSAAGVQRKKSCEVEYGSSKNQVYLAMSYSSTDRINLPSERGDTAGDPYDFDKECERSTKSEKNNKTRQEDKSKDKQGKCQTQTHSKKNGALLKKKKSACKESMDQYLKEKHVTASDFVAKNKRSKPGHNKDTNLSNLSKCSRKNVDVVNNYTADGISNSEQDSVCLESPALCVPKEFSSKTQKCQKKRQKKRHKKEITEKNVNRLMGRLLGKKRNASTCQDSNEEEEYDHHDALCLSKGDSASPVKIPYCEITLDEIVGVPRLHGENNHLPCFKHHEHQGNQQKRAHLESPKTTDTAYRSDFHFGRKQESVVKNHNSKSVTTKGMKKTQINDVRRRHLDQWPSTKTQTSFTDEIENIDSESSDDQLCRSDDVSLEEELPLENSIITRFNQFCKKMVGELEEDVPIDKTRKETSRTLDCTNRRKEIPACRNNNDDELNSTNEPRTPKFVLYDPEDQVEICSIKTPMTLPCSDIEGSQEGSIPSDDLQIQPLQESSKAERNRNRGNRSLQDTKNTDLSGILSGYSSEIRPSRTSMKRKYDIMLQCEDDDDVYRNNQNAGYDLSDTLELEMCHLRPRRLFSSDFKAVVEITGSSDDEDKEDVYGRSQASSRNTGSNELMGGSTSHLEGISVDAGVSGIVKAFGMDFKKQMQTKQHCLDVLSKTVLKSSQKHLKNMLTDRTERRASIMERFGKKLLAELTALGIDVRTLEDNEAKTLDFFQQQMKNINKCRISQEKRLENLRNMQLDFVASMCHMDQYESNQQTTFKNAMKKDLTTMQRKLLADAQRQELTTVRRSLHTMIG